MKSLEAVIFDMDGVLTETSHQHYLAWKMLAKSLGFELAEEVNDQVKGISRLGSLDIVLRAGNMADRFTNEEKIDLSNQKNQIYQSLIREFTKENLAPGALALLTALRDNKIRTGLASVSKNAPFLLEAMEIHHFFDTVVNPNEVKNSKPAPDIFLQAAKKLNVKPTSCIGIEDAFAGIEAIKRAGMKPIGIGSSDLLNNCDSVFSSLTDVNMDILRSLI